ncbi:MAG: hypothetical protein ACPG4T_04855, partial [Nannocystaceae bacterium]
MQFFLPCLLLVGMAPPVGAADAGDSKLQDRGVPDAVAVEGTETDTTTSGDTQELAGTTKPTSETTDSAPATDDTDSTPSSAGVSDGGDSWVADGEGLDFDFGALAGEDSDANPDNNAGTGSKAPLDAPPEATAKTTKKSRVKAGDILSGALRLTGAFLHFPDEPLLFANGDDGMVLGEGRFILNAPAGKHVRFDVNTFVDVSRLPAGGALSGAFTSASSSGSVYRTRYLSWNYWGNGGVSGNLGLDRAAVSFLAGPVKIDVGRFPLNYTVTGAFTPNDVYAPFSATTVNRIFKPGVDALRFSFAAGTLASIDVMGVLGYGANDAPTWGRSSVLARAGLVGGGFEWAVLGGKLAERWIVGGSAQGDAGPIGLRTEFHVGFPDADGNGRKQADNERPIYVRAAGGPNVSFAWHNTSLSAEYMFVSDGESSATNYLDRAAQLLPDDVPYLGRHYVSASFGL